jgi:hypothetical protein
MARAIDNRKILFLTAACLLAFVALAGATQAAQAVTDTCLKVAAAKYAQWDQKRVMIMETRTFADGSMRNNELIFTHNTVYGQLDNRSWNSLPILRRQRGAGSPEMAAKTMGLAECHAGEAVAEAGRQATIYTYTYVPDAQGNQASGKIWIADATGLPLRQDLQERSKPENQQVAMQISTHYSYDGDVKLPSAAERADMERRAVASSWLRNMQTGHPAASQ